MAAVLLWLIPKGTLWAFSAETGPTDAVAQTQKTESGVGHGGVIEREAGGNGAVASTPLLERADPRQRPAATMPGRITSLPSGANVAIIKVEGLIYDFTFESFKRRAEKAIQDGASLIIVELDTPGGLVTSAQKISKHIKSLAVPCVAWINNEAYSAGIMIASACDWIVMAPSSAAGDCAPIIPNQSMSPTERAKALSPILEEFRDSAARNGYDYAMFHAMCVFGVELYLVENRATGVRRVVNKIDYQLMVDGVEPEEASSPAGDESPVGGVGRQSATDGDIGQWVAASRGRYGPIVQPVHDGKTLLTVNQTRAMEYGLAAGLVKDEAELKQMVGAANIGRYDQAWVEGVAYWLTRPWVRGILLFIAMVCAYIEFQSPGVTLPGIIASAAMILLLGAPFVIGLAEVWHLVLFLVGFVLLMIEIFVTPGFGALGLTGLACMFLGLVLAVVPSGGSGLGLPDPQMMKQLEWSALWMLAGSMASMGGVFVLTKYFGRLPILSRMVLKNPPAEAVGGGIREPHKAISGDEVIGGGRIAVGDVGQVVSELRPTGQAFIKGQLVDVMSPGAWVEPGKRVKVVQVRGNLIDVEVVD